MHKGIGINETIYYGPGLAPLRKSRIIKGPNRNKVVPMKIRYASVDYELAEELSCGVGLMYNCEERAIQIPPFIKIYAIYHKKWVIWDRSRPYTTE